MNEPKRRGRPPKVAAPVVPVINGDEHYQPEPKDDRAQAMADRIWQGQSPDLPRAVRVDRIKSALEAQGLSMEGVTL